MASVAGREILESKSTSNTMTPIRVFLSKYFYFSMSLVFAALVLWGFSRTVDANLVHANPPRPVLLWFHGAAFSTWVVFFIARWCECTGLACIVYWAGLEQLSQWQWWCWDLPSRRL